jgi:hypothetical protein
MRRAPAAVTVSLDQPGSPRIARALSLLIEEINATPPPGPAFNPRRTAFAGDLGP